MNSKSLSIGILSVTGLILMISQFLPVQQARAEVWKDRDYSLLTAQSSRGDQLVFVVDNRSGLIAALTWDPAAKNFQVDGVGQMAEAFK